MNVIIPMAGLGKRMRPHTLTTPKPLLPVAGFTIVERLIQAIHEQVPSKINEIAFVIGNFGPEVETMLLNTAKKFGAEGKIFFQHTALGTAHAIHCAKLSLKDEVIVAFADTLFEGSFNLDTKADATVWVKSINDPSNFGVVVVDENNNISSFVEKPKHFISNLAIIGIYHFKDGENLCQEIEYLINNNIMKSNEYQLTDVLENMKNKGKVLKAGQVSEWLDFGNKNIFIDSVQKILHKNQPKTTRNYQNTTIIHPCYIADDVEIIDSVIGPNVSIESGCKIEHSTIKNSVIYKNTQIINAHIIESMIGNNVYIRDTKTLKEYNIGDYTTIDIK